MTLKLHASRLAAAIPENVRRALALDPADALTRELALDVVPVEQLRDSRGAGGWCDGVSLATDRVICYAPTPESRRQNFTLLHELGHILINGDDEALDWLADRPDPSSDLERLCDAIAAEILLPTSTIAHVLAGRTPAPRHLRELYAASRASEEVCAIALAARLPVRGAVVLIQRRIAAVTFAASSGWPPLSIPRGLAVPARHPLRDLGTRQRWTGWTTSELSLAFTERLAANIPYPSASLLRALAEAGPRRTTLILLDIPGLDEAVDDHIHWIPGLGHNASQDTVISICRICGNDMASNNYPCEECGVPPCPECGRCRCL
jgi:Zn-dependent peptidase ImmA (M78 family)